jgi:hypothetical protein
MGIALLYTNNDGTYNVEMLRDIIIVLYIYIYIYIYGIEILTHIYTLLVAGCTSSVLAY